MSEDSDKSIQFESQIENSQNDENDNHESAKEVESSSDGTEITIDDQYWVVEEIVDVKIKKGKKHYKVFWKGDSKPTWVP